MYPRSLSRASETGETGIGQTTMTDAKLLAMNDRSRLGIAAESLQRSEWDIFVMAYRAWHQVEPDDRSLNADFGRYLGSGQAPPYVRHYVAGYLREHPELLRRFVDHLHSQRRAEIRALLAITALVLAALILF